jgi:hypothetical protein
VRQDKAGDERRTERPENRARRPGPTISLVSLAYSPDGLCYFVEGK